MLNEVEERRSLSTRRQEIVETAHAMATREGWGAVTLRALAARVGCSAPAIYQYFRDKDAVLTALAAQGHMLLNQSMEQAVADVHGPAKRLRAMVKAVWDYSREQPALFAVMVGLDGQRAHRDAATGTLAPAAMGHAADEFLAKRDSGESSQDLADRLFATACGFIVLVAGGSFPGDAEQAFALLSRTVDAMLKDVGR
jgi:AcrR family transcriptional regulator